MPRQYIRDFKPGDRVESTFFLQKLTLAPFRDPSRGMYLTMTLGDRTGQIQGRIWERAEEIAGGLDEQTVVRVTGVAEEYRGQIQLAVQDITPHSDQSPALFAEFLPAVRSDVRRLQAQLEKILLSIDSEPLVRLARHLFSQRQFYDAYTSAPAAKQIHHAGRGGLLEHSLEVVELCEAAARLYPMLDRDLLVVGALLHDIGKIKEYSMVGAIDFTDEGRLLGHAAIGLRMLDEAVAELSGFPAAVHMHLTHLILSHMGQLEYGASILPQTPEAAALHQADMMSSQLKQFEQLIGAAGEQAWAPYDRTLGRFVYTGFVAKGPAKGGGSEPTGGAGATGARNDGEPT